VQRKLNPANVPKCRPIEDYWGILKRKVYEIEVYTIFEKRYFISIYRNIGHFSIYRSGEKKGDISI
jgi:hypothetical protein